VTETFFPLAPVNSSDHAFTAFIHSNSPFVRFSLAPHSDPAQYLKTSQPAIAKRVKARVGRNEAEEMVAAVVVTVTMVGPPPGSSGKPGRAGQYCQKNVACI
jgi:hypothetical protein